MEYRTKSSASCFSVTLVGKVTFRSIDDLKSIVDQFIKEEAPDIEFDMRDVEMVDSSGLGQFITAFDAAEAKGGKIVIKNAKGIVLSLLKTTKFDDLAVVE